MDKDQTLRLFYELVTFGLVKANLYKRLTRLKGVCETAFYLNMD